MLYFIIILLFALVLCIVTGIIYARSAKQKKKIYQQKTEEAERLSELRERFRSLLDNMPEMAFTKDAETGKYLACNQAFADYAHKNSPEEVEGLTDAQIFDAETAEHFTKADKIALSLSKPYIFYEEVHDAEGNLRQFQTTKLKYTDTNGRFCVLGMCQDVTDFIRIQHEQAMTKEAYEGAVQTSLMYTHIAQTLARDYTEMFYVNTDTEEFTEYRKKENTLSEIRHGWHFFSDCKAELSEKIYPEDKDVFLTAMNRKKLMKALSSKDTFVTTFRCLFNNKPVYVSMKVSRMESDENHIIIGFMDVDAEMREAIAKNEALSNAISSAEKAHHAKTSFLSGMSHELRTPINAIIGLNTLALKNQNLDEKTRNYFEKINDSAEHLLSMINEILEMNRMESGRESLSQTEFSLRSMLEQIYSQVLAQYSKKDIQYEWQVLLPEEDTYIGDDKKLKQALFHVFSNMMKSVENAGTITLTAEKTEEFEEQVHLCFCMKDTGKEVNRNSAMKIFSDESSLDMIVTRKILELMDGSFSISEEKDGCTKMTITVILHKGNKKELEPVGEINPLALSVLVVDDNPIEAEHAKMVLEEAGIHTEFCTSGQEALRKMEIQHIRKQPYSFILMDWNMPGMSGKETSAEIHRLYEQESFIIAMTAYSWEDIQEEALEAGVDSYLEKPLFIANVIENLGKIAKQNHMTVFKEKKKARLEGRRILLAEDVELNAEILMDILEMENIKADHAENGKIAVELFENSTEGIYSAILMDVRMPQMDGLEASKKIRSLEREDAKRIPIIALTANAFDEDVQLSIQAGMNAHLSKPVEAELLIQTLGELIYKAEENLTSR